MNVNLASILRHSAREYPDATAVSMHESRLSYRQLCERVAYAAGVVNARGLRPGDVVALLIGNQPHFPVWYYASLATGCVVTTLSLLLRENEVAHCLADSGAKLLVAVDGHGVVAGGAAESVGCDLLVVDERAAECACAGPFEIVLRAPHDPAIILYTSGTTGRPKGAVISHSSILWNTVLIAQAFRYTSEDRIVAALPLAHTFGQTCTMNAAMFAGAELVLMPRFAAHAGVALVEAGQATVIAGVPSMFIEMLAVIESREGPRSISGLRLALTGAAPVAPETLTRISQALHCPILEGYGMSECTCVICFNAAGREPRLGSVGKPLSGVEVRVADESGRALPAGETGEVLVLGHGLMLGYRNQPEANAASFSVDGWFRTGDLGRFDSDGYLFLVGRVKDMVNRGGYKVYPREVEDALYEHPGVQEVAVVGAHHPRLGEEVVAYVVARKDHQLEEKDLIAHARARVAAYKYPRRIVMVKALPKGPSGKLLRRELRPEPFEGT